MSTESLPPLDGPSQVDTAQQHVVHGLLTALLGASPEDTSRRVHDIFSYIDRQCGTSFRGSEGAQSGTASPLPETEVARTKAPPATSRAADSVLLSEPPGTTPQSIHPGNRFRSVATVLVRHWRAGIGGLAAAAVVVFAVVSFFQHTPSARADDTLLRAAALTFVWLPDIDPFLSDNPAALQAQLDEIEDYKRQRDEILRKAAAAPTAQARANASDPGYFPWARAYRLLRDIGRFDEALAEADACLKFMDDIGYPHGPSTWYCVVLGDLGNIYMAAADFPKAREAFLASIDIRIEGDEQLARRDNWASDFPQRFTSPVHSLTPLYRSMVLLCIAEGKFEEAHQWCQKADDALRDYFGAICRANGIAVPDGADALTAFQATPPIFQNPPASLTQDEASRYEAQYRGFAPTIQDVTKLREYLLVSARLALAEERISAAEETLRMARAVPYSGCHDESRLDFNEPLLAARIAIAQGRYESALASIDQAQLHTGPPDCSDIANERPIAPARLAELTLLKGAALLGLDEKSAEGAQLVEKALAVPHKLAAGLPPEQREAFMKRFEPWQKLADEVRRNKP
jgi:tetratricopeptide (TPR) repeat protein